MAVVPEAHSDWVHCTCCSYPCSALAVEQARQTLCKGYSCWCSVLLKCWDNTRNGATLLSPGAMTAGPV